MTVWVLILFKKKKNKLLFACCRQPVNTTRSCPLKILSKALWLYFSFQGMSAAIEIASFILPATSFPPALLHAAPSQYVGFLLGSCV